MPRSQGLDSFRRAEFARAQSGKRSSMSRTALHNVIMSSAGKPFSLPDGQDQMLKAIAVKNCFRCHGAGVSKWKHGGTMAEVCVCVQRRAPAMNDALEEQKTKIEAELAEAKAEVTSGDVSEENRPEALADPEVRPED